MRTTMTNFTCFLFLFSQVTICSSQFPFELTKKLATSSLSSKLKTRISIDNAFTIDGKTVLNRVLQLTKFISTADVLAFTV